MAQVQAERVARLAFAGALGGLLAFVAINPSYSAQEEAHQFNMGGHSETSAADLFLVYMIGAVLGSGIGACLIAADELRSRSIIRVVLYTLAGAIVGGLCGFAGGFVAQTLFSALLGGGEHGVSTSMLPLLLVARTAGWSLMGAGAGLCPGVVARSSRRILQGVIGGLAGGFVGGFTFDGISLVTQNGSVSRAVGFTLIGLMVGALFGLVEELGKQYWLTALNGAKEGRAFILAKPITLLGRSEMADIPLFGDGRVARQQARLVRQGKIITLVADPGAPVTRNNQPIQSTPLTDGDIVGVGPHRFRFQSRRAAGVGIPALPPLGPEYGAMAGGYAPPGTVGTLPPVGYGGSGPLTGGFAVPISGLQAVTGPHMGQIFPLIPNAIVGRDPRSDIALTGETQASRQHARLFLDPAGTGWILEDGGSTNGTWVNGGRVQSHRLAPGDQISIGQTVLRVV